MNITRKQKRDLESIMYFIPEKMRCRLITDEDKEAFLSFSDKGIKPEITLGVDALIQGKRWRGIHIHEMYEPGVLDGSMPWYVVLGGLEEPMPRGIVDFIKKEAFKGNASGDIEDCYRETCQ